MTPGWILLSGLICLLIWLLRNATGEMLKVEMQTRLCRIPNVLIRVAALLLPAHNRRDQSNEWLGELAFIVNETEGLPVTRLLRGIRFSGSLLWTARSMARALEGDQEPKGYRGPTACAAARITYRQLDYWARTGLVEPSVAATQGGDSQRLYDSRDILVLAAVKRLLDSGISLQLIRAAVHHLGDYRTEDLNKVTLLCDGDHVFSCTSRRESVKVLQSGEGIFGISLSRVWREIERELAGLPAVRVFDGIIVAPEPRISLRKPFRRRSHPGRK